MVTQHRVGDAFIIICYNRPCTELRMYGLPSMRRKPPKCLHKAEQLTSYDKIMNMLLNRLESYEIAAFTFKVIEKRC